MKRSFFSTIALMLLVMLPFSTLMSQTIYPTKISKPAHFDISKPLRDVEPIPPGVRERSWKKNLIKNHEGFLEDMKNRPEMIGPDPVLQDAMTGSRSEPIIPQNFPGVANLNGVAPPDTDGDVGPNHYLQMINLSFSIWDKEGNMLMAPADNQTIWEGFDDGQPFDNANDGDPIVLYDEQADRWLVSQFAVSNPNNKFYELIAISATPDPLGAWYRYAFEFDKMPDYPKFGIWPDGYYFTSNLFTNGSSWAGGGISIVDRDAMLAGEPEATMVFFALGSSFGSLLPADFDGPTPPPEGSPNYCLNLGSNILRLWEVDVDWDNVDNSTVAYTQTLQTESFSTNNISIQQPGTSTTLGTLADRLMYRLQYRNFGDYEVMVTNHSVNAGGGRGGVRWYEFRKSGDENWSIYQQGTYAPDDGESRWMGSIAMNDLGDIAIGYSVSSNSTYPSIRVAGQTAGAPEGLGILDIDEVSILEGDKSQTGVNRWGDYAMMSVDPSDGQTFWFTTEYSNGGWSWRTQIASISFVSEPVADFISTETFIPVGETIDFTDESSGVPASWEWTFEGGTPETSTEQNPEGIVYNTEGAFDVQLIVSNDLGIDTILKADYITSSSTILPEVDFTSDKDYTCMNEAVSFTDNTLNSPNQWLWEFEPATVTFVNGTDENSENPQVTFDAAGTYSVALTAWNLNGSAMLNKPELVHPGGYTPFFRETFEESGFMSQGWTVENPDSDQGWELFEVGGTIPGNHAAGIDFDSDFGKRDRLISPPYNLENMSSAALEFMHAYAKKHNEVSDSLIVLVSDDCGENWTRIFTAGEDGSGNLATHEQTSDFWPETADDWCGAGWGASCISLDLSNWAGNADVRIAFETYSAIGNPLFIDNIEISQYVAIDNNIGQASQVSVYPNPTGGNFSVVLPDENGFTELQLLNYLGQVIEYKAIDEKSQQIEIERQKDWNAGTYFLRLSGQGQSVTKKVILQ